MSRFCSLGKVSDEYGPTVNNALSYEGFKKLKMASSIRFTQIAENYPTEKVPSLVHWMAENT
jgi:hypothetical protein